MIIEICTTTLGSIMNAQDAGANRLELCENYQAGGVTPNIEFFEKSKIYKEQSKQYDLRLKEILAIVRSSYSTF